MNSESLINWIEGYLDACKNKPTHNQIKEIRKKIEEYRKPSTSFWSPGTITVPSPIYGPGTTLLTDSPRFSYNEIPVTKSNGEDVLQNNNSEIDELIEKAKRATTMEDLEQ